MHNIYRLEKITMPLIAIMMCLISSCYFQKLQMDIDKTSIQKDQAHTTGHYHTILKNGREV